MSRRFFLHRQECRQGCNHHWACTDRRSRRRLRMSFLRTLGCRQACNLNQGGRHFHTRPSDRSIVCHTTDTGERTAECRGPFLVDLHTGRRSHRLFRRSPWSSRWEHRLDSWLGRRRFHRNHRDHGKQCRCSLERRPECNRYRHCRARRSRYRRRMSYQHSLERRQEYILNLPRKCLRTSCLRRTEDLRRSVYTEAWSSRGRMRPSPTRRRQ